MCRKLIYIISFILVFSLVRTGIGQEVDLNLAGWWMLDGNANDSSGNNNHGTLFGNPQWVAGKIGGALDFDGTDDYVDCGNAPSLDITGQITIAAWIYPTGGGGGGYGRIVDKSSGTGATAAGYKIYPRSAENYIVTLSVGGGDRRSSASLVLNTWNYMALVITGTQWRFFLNGTWQEWNDTRFPSSVNNPLFIGNSSTGARHFDGMMDDVRIYNKALTEEEIREAMRGAQPGMASKPTPEDEAIDVPRDVKLSWKPGEFANTHDVYLGTVFDDVNDAGRTNPRGVLVSQNQAPNSYGPAGLLQFGQTYYWRVDEVSAPPDNTIFKGDVWQFTVEPIAYLIAQASITATASSSNAANEGPENTINGSGLGADDMHSAENKDMWLSSMTGQQPTWIQYELDQVYKLHQMLVWNYNSSLEPVIGFGIKQAVIEYSTDGASWAALGTVEFARGSGAAGLPPNTTVELGGIAAKYVKITANSNWGGILTQYGLSEVRFFYIPVVSREPDPASGATDMSVDNVTLSWRAGREAAKHNLYLSTDQQAVIDETVSAVSISANSSYASYDTGPLDLAKSYYWKINEVNEAETPTTWQGDVLSFSTQEFLVVDSFEDYNDFEPDRIFDTWVDGWGVPTNGSQIGSDVPPFAEQTIVHGGKQSMPLHYSNTAGATYSEAQRTFAAPQNWTQHGVKTLSLWFSGAANNVAGLLYVKVNGSKVIYDGAASNLTVGGWQVWNIELTSFGMNLQRVTTLSIGIDGNGATGTLYFDDIRLYPFSRELITPAEPNTAGLVAHYKFDQDATDSSGNNNHGTLFGNPKWVAGKIGGALELDGVDDYVDCGNNPSLAITGEITIAAWIYPTGSGSSNFPRIVDKSGGTAMADPGYKIYPRAAENYVVTLSAGGAYRESSSSVVLNTWNYLAFVITGTQWKLFINGIWEQWDESTFPSSVSNPLYIGNSSSGARHFIGIMDDVRIYNRALTSGEIAWLAGITEPFDKPF